MNDPEMLRYWVLLSMIFGAGSTKVLEAMRVYDTPQEIWEAVCAGRLPNLPPAVKKAAADASPEQADRIVHYCRSSRIELLPITDDRYPALLTTIYAPPFLLTAQGEFSLLEKPLSLAVVGTRHPSPYSVMVTNRIVSEICRDDFVIVSGFAKGIDATAHAAALNAGGSTIAVLGCGVNQDYPRENTRLKQMLLTSGRGLLLSEYLPGTPPIPANFPKRNRILSGLAEATAVIEAAHGSGSLLTAECACEQGRNLLCVPPADIFDRRYAGVIPLLRDGAIPLMSAGDVRAAYYDRYPQYVSLGTPIRESERAVYAEENAAMKAASEQQKAAAQKPSAQPEKPKPAPKPVSVKEEPAGLPAEKPQTSARTDLPDSEDGALIVQYLREHGGTDVDTLAEVLDMDLSALLSTLTLLELDDYVTSLFGKHYFPAE